MQRVTQFEIFFKRIVFAYFCRFVITITLKNKGFEPCHIRTLYSHVHCNIG